MRIPDYIRSEHVKMAAADVLRNPIPRNRSYDRYYLDYEGKKYPVKYIVSLANVFANESRVMLDPGKFNTYDAQEHLEKLGFDIVDTLAHQEYRHKGFKLLSLALFNNSLLGSIRYSFVEDEDKQDQIYSTVLIGPNGTGKSNLFRIVIELFRELYNLSQQKKERMP
jgi:hypothetical protein